MNSKNRLDSKTKNNFNKNNLNNKFKKNNFTSNKEKNLSFPKDNNQSEIVKSQKPKYKKSSKIEKCYSNTKSIFSNIDFIRFYDDKNVKSIYHKTNVDGEKDFINFLNKKTMNSYKKIYNFLLENNSTDHKDKIFDLSKVEFNNLEPYCINLLKKKWPEIEFDDSSLEMKNFIFLKFRINNNLFGENFKEFINKIRIFGLFNLNEKTIKIVLLDHYHLFILSGYNGLTKEENYKKILNENINNNICHSKIFDLN